MNSLEINKILSRNNVTSPFYIGCFPANQIPLYASHYPLCMVVNMDPGWLPGSHWIAIYSPCQNWVEYYDSFAIWPPPSEYICKFLQTFNFIRFNYMPLQSPSSSACGKHAIYFLYNRCAGFSFDNIIKYLANRKKADTAVSHFFRNNIFNKL